MFPGATIYVLIAVVLVLWFDVQARLQCAGLRLHRLSLGHEVLRNRIDLNTEMVIKYSLICTQKWELSTLQLHRSEQKNERFKNAIDLTT